jgi:hypothetical protein
MISNRRRAGRQQFWEKHIAEWSATELSQVEYCRLNKIGIKSFQYWKRKTVRGSAPALVELPLLKSMPVSAFSPPPSLCLVVDRYRVEIGKGFDSEDLERVVRILGRI